MKIKLVVAAIAAVQLSACATIVSGSNQEIAFTSAGSAKTCTATGGSRLGLNETFTTPAVVTVKRSKKDINVACTDGSSERVMGEYNAWTLGNFLNLTGLVGVGIDAATGAIHKYPEDVVIDNDMAMSNAVIAEETVMP